MKKQTAEKADEGPPLVAVRAVLAWGAMTSQGTGAFPAWHKTNKAAASQGIMRSHESQAQINIPKLC